MDDAALPQLFGGLIAVALWVYALTGGADFGGGVWDLLASGPRKMAQRQLIAKAISPIWEANHVWLILVVVLLFVAFPVAFAAILTALHVPLVAMLVGITLRGAAFVFRSYGPETPGWQKWGAVFAIASAVTPVLLGVVLGAVSSGALQLNAQRQVQTDFVSEWLALFPWALGAMVLALFAWLAAVYLCVEAEDRQLQDDFRFRAVAANLAFGVTAGLAALASPHGAPHLGQVLLGTPHAWLMQGVTAAVALLAIAALLQRLFRLARALAIVQVTLVVAAWVVAQNGQLLVGQLGLSEAAAPASVLRPIAWTLVAGAALLVPAFVWLYRVFKGKPPAEE